MGLLGGAVNVILLLVSDIDDNFWFHTGHRTEKLVIINKTSFVTTPPNHPGSDPVTSLPSPPSTYKAALRPQMVVVGGGGGGWRWLEVFSMILN